MKKRIVTFFQDVSEKTTFRHLVFLIRFAFSKCQRYLPTSDIIANTAPFPRNTRQDRGVFSGRADIDVTFVQRKGIGLPTLLTFA